MGKRVDQAGRLVDDPVSSSATRSQAFGRLATYLLGKPLQPVLLDNAGGDLQVMFRGMSDDDLDQLIAEARQILDTPGNDKLQGPGT